MAEHPFSRLAHRHKTAALSTAEAQFEEARVYFVLQRFGLSRLVGEVRTSDPGGADRLTFAAFNSLFPSFPLLLAVSSLGGIKLHVDPRAFLPSMFKKFADVPFVPFYEEVFEDLYPRANGRAVGMVFHRNGIRGGLVIYNADEFEPPAYTGVTVMYQGGDHKHRHRLYVRPFQEVILAIWNGGHGWKPD